MFFIIVKAFVWKVLLRAVQVEFDDFTHYLLSFNVVYEMIMSQSVIVEKVYKNELIVDKTASNVWIGKP
jgi:hypothetical protein